MEVPISNNTVPSFFKDEIVPCKTEEVDKKKVMCSLDRESS